MCGAITCAVLFLTAQLPDNQVRLAVAEMYISELPLSAALLFAAGKLDPPQHLKLADFSQEDFIAGFPMLEKRGISYIKFERVPMALIGYIDQPAIVLSSVDKYLVTYPDADGTRSLQFPALASTESAFSGELLVDVIVLEPGELGWIAKGFLYTAYRLAIVCLMAFVCCLSILVRRSYQKSLKQ
jgi:hypothetical protein